MKYIIMLYGSQQDYDAMAGNSSVHPELTPEDFGPLYAFMEKFNNDLVESGEWVDAAGLSAPAHARRISTRDGATVVTDGPYAETQEVLAGYNIVECESFDRATEIAARMAQAPSPKDIWKDTYVDVRPIMGGAPDLDG